VLGDTPNPPPLPPPVTHGNLALILEDDPLVRRALVRGLLGMGYVCQTASSLSEAQSIVDKLTLAIVDIDLPDGSGLVWAELSREENPTTRRIFFSATEDAEVIRKASALGDFIPKADGVGAVLARAQALLGRPTSSVPAPPISAPRAAGAPLAAEERKALGGD
jgi:DNA-binding response OmpR family regulator